MPQFEDGDRVRIDIPDKIDPDFECYHRRRGTIVATLEDNAAELTNDDLDNELCHVEFDDGKQQDFRWRDLRPVSE